MAEGSLEDAVGETAEPRLRSIHGASRQPAAWLLEGVVGEGAKRCRRPVEELAH